MYVVFIMITYCTYVCWLLLYWQCIAVHAWGSLILLWTIEHTMKHLSSRASSGIQNLTKPVMGETLHWFTSISWCARSSKEGSSCYQVSMPNNFHENMHEVFHSFHPTSPSSAPTWWGAISCREWWRWHTSSVVASTYMIPCSIVRLCSGVLLLSKQHCLFSFVICIPLFSSRCRCHRCECVCSDSDDSRWWRRYCHHHCCHQMEEQEEERGRRL